MRALYPLLCIGLVALIGCATSVPPAKTPRISPPRSRPRPADGYVPELFGKSRPIVVFSGQRSARRSAAAKSNKSAPEIPAPAPPAPPPPPDRPPLLVSAEDQELFMSFWPKTDEEITERIRQRLVFYTEGAIPPVYQAWDKGKASGAVFVNGGQRTANLEFPWRSTAGLDDCPNAKVIRAVALESNGLRWWPEKLSNGASNGIRWEYAPGTVFCEILLVTDERGGDHTFELRTRRKVPAGTWVVNVYRPFPTEDSLREAVAKRGFRYPDVTGQRLTKQSVNVRESDGRAVRGLVSFEADFVPVADLRARPDLVRDLLDTAVFTSAKHNPWRDRHDGLPGAFAPAIDTLTTRNDSFSIVPVNYEGSFLKVGQTSCMRCHDDAGKVVVEPGDTRWRIRGDDAIFSFHPFDPDGLAAGVMRLNPRLVGAGLIARKEFP